MKKNIITLFAAAFLTASPVSFGAPVSPASTAKPNIIFILGDDVGMGDVGFSGSDAYKTPNLDALAAGGTRFANAYAEPLCGPSRACILTGRYPFRTGATNQDAVGQIKPADVILMPTVLKQAGYVSSLVGKWSQFSLTPTDFGFDDGLNFKASGVYWNTQKNGKDYVVNGKTIPLRDKEYLPDVMHDHIVNFITKHHDNPFYIYYSMSHIHNEILSTPDSAPDSKTLYADNIAYMDKLIGKLVAELERQKLREKTIIVYFGDNGTANQQAPTSTVGGRRLSGAKGSMLEGGSRVPMMVNWPGTTPAGTVSKDLIDSTDFFATFAEAAGAQRPKDVIYDGRSFLPQLRGEKGNPRDTIFVQLARKWYVLEHGWKLTQDAELFDLSGAPWEEKLVPADTKDEAAIKARARLSAVLAGLNPAGGILDQGDGTGRHANKKGKAPKDE